MMMMIYSTTALLYLIIPPRVVINFFLSNLCKSHEYVSEDSPESNPQTSHALSPLITVLLQMS